MGRTIGETKPGALVLCSGRKVMVTKPEYDKLLESGLFKPMNGFGDSKAYSVTLEGSRLLHRWNGDAPVIVMAEDALSGKERGELNFIRRLLSGQLKFSKPFDLFEYKVNKRQYMKVSLEMAERLHRAGYGDFLYDRESYDRSSSQSFDPCVRLSDGFRLFSWNNNLTDDEAQDIKEIQVGDLREEERKSYKELLNRLRALGFECAEPKQAAKQQSFTEALYQDRKAAAVKAAQPVVAADHAVNTTVDACTDSDRKMLKQRDTLFTALPARCFNLLHDIDSLNRRYGWPDEEVRIAAAELQQACRKFEKLFGKKHPELKAK